MGLDMYLKGKKYVSEYFEKDAYEKLNSFDIGQKSFKINSVEIEVMYWRKANAIHRWFVRECQNGVDDCREYYVSPEKLRELRDLCREVLENRDRASELLPTSSGFFFGDIEYDEWYFDSIERTVIALTEILDDEEFLKVWEINYQSSW